MKRSDFVLSLGQRLTFLLCLFLICYMLTFGCSYIVGRLLADRLPAALRISSLLQDVIAFIIPAVGTAVLVTRKPAALLCLARHPSLPVILMVALVLAVSIPAQEAVIYWNYNISLPEAMASFEAVARQMESAAFGTMEVLLSDTSVGGLIVNLLIVGVAAAFAEELLFRGCFQRLLTTAGVNGHVAVWVVAFCFSAMHMQFFGFVPRMLLGAYFGYLLLWTRSLWIPVTAHLLNNAMFVITAYHQIRTDGPGTLSEEPTLWPAWQIAVSAVLTVIVLRCIYIYSKKTNITAEE